MSVFEAVERDLAEIRKRDKDLADSALAATALALAAEMDAGNSATSKSMCARELRETLMLLKGLAPPKAEKDGLDGILGKRDARIAGRSRAAH